MLAPVVNKAADLGPQMVSWWKDWRGQACAIIASGPSTKGSGFEKLRGRMPVIAIKENAYDLCTWADVAYGCDLAWWIHRRGLQAFKGLKIGWDAKIPQHFPDVKTITLKEKQKRPSVTYVDDLLLDDPGVIGAGGNSGFQAFNLAAQFGATRILLIGCDMHDRSGAHWYGRNNWFKGNNPSDSNFRTWIKAFENSAQVCRNAGIDVINASPHSALNCFRRATVDQALSEWGL